MGYGPDEIAIYFVKASWTISLSTKPIEGGRRVRGARGNDAGRALDRGPCIARAHTSRNQLRLIGISIDAVQGTGTRHALVIELSKRAAEPSVQ
jgi:hypothetical protein